MDEKKNELTPSVKLDLESNNITQQIINETDPSKIDDLTQLFMLNKKKKNLVRMNKLSNLLDVIDDEVILRFSEEPDTFNNDQLVKYMTATQQILGNISQEIEKTPLIQINNQKNEIHINEEGLSRESRMKVLDVISKILDNPENIIDVEEEPDGTETR